MVVLELKLQMRKLCKLMIHEKSLRYRCSLFGTLIETFDISKHRKEEVVITATVDRKICEIQSR